MQKIYNKISLKSRIINKLFILTKCKKHYSTTENIKKFIDEYQGIKHNYVLPTKLEFNKYVINDTDVYIYNGTIDDVKDNVLIYVHGGSFVEEAISHQLNFAIKIADKTNSTLIFPRYKLIPDGNYKDLYNLLDYIYDRLNVNNHKINLLGDSSGGGFILSYAMYLRDNNKKMPNNILTLSPWLDLTMSNPELKEYEKFDSLSAIEGNIYCGKLWANDIDTKNSLVSPMYGDFYNLPTITIATGSYDILKPDCMKLSKKLTALGISHNYIEFKKQGHDFGCYPTKEGKMLVDDFSKIIND